jgi:hypothetical protein
MNLNKRIELLAAIGTFLNSNGHEYDEIRERAYRENKWFTVEYIQQAGIAIATKMLNPDLLSSFAQKYKVKDEGNSGKTVGIIMAGNIPFVGFHDFLCVFLSGYRQRIKLSSKDSILMNMILDIASKVNQEVVEWVKFDEMLKGCDAYIATGTDNSARYFEYYFKKYPHIIRKNRTSVAVLDGSETAEELSSLADDIQLYFGLGCRNVTQVLVPEDYDFVPLLNALRKYDQYRDHEKYRNNFDYQLTIALLNNKFYMSNDSIVLLENESPFSPISQLHYQFYKNKENVIAGIDPNKIQCLVGHGHLPFGMAQQPELTDFPDGFDTMAFLSTLS